MGSGLTFLGDSEFHSYAHKVSSIPFLSDEEEKNLANKWYNHRDIDAAQKLVSAYLRLVVKVALRYRNYGLPLMDMVSEGNIGLMKAVKNFNPTFGFKVATYAVWWIKSAIQEYILKSWSLVKIGSTATQRKLFFSLRKIKNCISSSCAGDKSNADIIKEVADNLNVQEKDAIAMDGILSHKDLSLNLKVDNDDEVEMHEIIESNEDGHELVLINNQELRNKKTLLRAALLSLNARYRRIFIARKLLEKPKTLKELSAEFSISAERVRQIEKRVIEKIKEYIRSHDNVRYESKSISCS